MEKYFENNKIKKIFDDYREVVFSTNIDLYFWKSFTDKAIEDYISIHGNSKLLYQAIFSVNDLNSSNNNKLPDFYQKEISISTSNLKERRQHLYSWMINLSLLKIYNAVEIFLLRSISLKYFSYLDDPLSSKNACIKLDKNISLEFKNNNLKKDGKNNRYLIDFIKFKSADFSEFAKQPIRSDLNTNWYNFFELISILRNIIVHNGMLITEDIENEIKSKAKDIFERHFNIDVSNSMPLLIPIENKIRDFMYLYNDFSLNTIKFLFEQKDLSFLGMKTLRY
ncbi:MAG: hypothetical protein GX879_10215 [Bacteroidales bacterium]|nr:hypothetical protein [Bacteroidales bacterium]